MVLHQDPLFRTELPVLTQQRSKVFVDFPHVVEQGGVGYLFDLFVEEPQFTSNVARVFRNSQRVARGIRVTSLDCLDHQLQKLSVDPLRLKIHLINVPNDEQRHDQDGELSHSMICVQVRQQNCKGSSCEIIEERATDNS